jgi:predicted nucleotidyltransferase
LHKHHEDAMHRAKDRILETDGVIAILLGGSIARGVERADSDVDLIVVVNDEDWDRRAKSGELTFVWKDVADWQWGYVEGRFLSQSFIAEAATRGSEPTRHSFISVKPIHSIDPGIESQVAKIPIYQEHERQYKIDAFMSQMQINRVYFHPDSIWRSNPFMLHRATTEIVLFAGRLILAHNRVLFPCQRRLMEYVRKAPDKPAEFEDMAFRFLADPAEDNREELVKMIESFTDWNVTTDWTNAFERDNEMSWFTRSYAIAEW